MGVYKINNTELDPQPSNGGWGERNRLGVDGYNRTIYAPTRAFQIRWDALSYTEYNALYQFYVTASTAGYITATLPTFSGSDYDTFTTYTQCVLDELSPGKLDFKYLYDVVMTIRNISA